ncbi:oligosaccharide flippase family protein [Ancylobacter sp. A5.8]|uniref:oligosaccharide flippase family protein n=1 Tax=Ancylobacter gelatini TaxID=2919920 RepID=UPI001F4EFF75|nr:oligosaccharide flippase family protein [Ancylobacter gelatini]MCJ8145239.1 oligosaccharide flippase family protein [Ancylobacter gelatini]
MTADLHALPSPAIKKPAVPLHSHTDARHGMVGHAVVHGMLWFFGQNAASRLVQAGSQIVLAWLLLPADFGLISLALMVSGIVSTAFQLGLDDVVLQRRHKMPVWFGALFWFSLGPAVACFLLLVAVAPLVAQIYDHPQLAGLLVVIALAVPLRAFSTVPVAIIRSRMNFRLLSMLGFAEVVVINMATIALAAGDFGAYSFAVPIPIGAVVFSGAAWAITRAELPRRRRHFRWTLLLPKSLAVSGTRLLTTLMSQGDALVLGLVASDVRVGLYFFAYRIAAQPVRLLGSSIGSVLFPALIHLSHDAARQRDAALIASQVLAIVVMPICFIQAAMAGPFIDLVFNQEWAGATFYMQILSIGLAFDAVTWVIGPLLPANGHFRRLIGYAIMNTGIFFTLIITGAWFSPDYGVALGVAAYFALVQPCVCYTVVNRVAHVSIPRYAAIYLVPAVPAAIGAFGSAALVANLSSAEQLVIAPVLALGFYAFCVWHLAPEPVRYMLARLQALRSRAG